MVETIAVVAESATRDGGAGGHVHASAGALRQAGVRVRVVAGSVSDDHDTTRVQTLTARQLDTDTVDEVLGLVTACDPAVVHVHDIWDRHLVEALADRWPLVLSIHNHATCASGQRYFRAGEECRRVHGAGCLPNLLSGRCTHRRDPRPVLGQYRAATNHISLLGVATSVVAYSRFVADDLRRAGLSSVRQVPYFADPEGEEVAAPAARRILFAGRLVPQKGLHVLVEALASLNATLVVLGDGWERDRIVAEIHRVGLTDRVELCGWSSGDEVRGAMERADVVCVPSVWPEPFGIVGLEAMAAGRPVVASATGGIPEWLVDGRTGHLVPPGDSRALAAALARLLDDPATARAMGKAGREHVRRRFSSEVHRAALASVYEEVGRRA